MRENTFYLPATGTDQGKPITHIKVNVYYSKGGINYFTATTEPRAIWCGISPVNREKSGATGLAVESFMLFSGLKCKLEEAKRLNRKRVAALFEQTKTEIASKTGLVYATLQQVLVKYDIALTEEAPA